MVNEVETKVMWGGWGVEGGGDLVGRQMMWIVWVLRLLEVKSMLDKGDSNSQMFRTSSAQWI